MSKNIILCSDGTGNKGGHGADTNVFRLFNAVDIHDTDANAIDINDTNKQITFYDDGVGTSKNKYLRAIQGAFGFGFETNVVDLYEFLARNYDTGDQIFLFGFSRGAATVRGFAGLIEACGLLDRGKCTDDNNVVQEHIFQERIDEARNAYRKHKGEKDGKTANTAADQFKGNMAVVDAEHAPHGNLKIRFIGVWDTVSALGFPQDWSWAFQWISTALDKFIDSLFPHNFYNYQLNDNVEYVYHALAIDDERTTFHPKVWNEKDDNGPKEIEQVWFAGVHSNVGGGYPRAGMSMVALDWMMERATDRGVRLNKDVHDEVRASANVDGRLYDSRSGAAIYYRYGPRDIEDLCKDSEGNKKIKGPVKIHDSVIDRITRGTSRYAPRSIPYEIKIVHTKTDGASRTVETAETCEEYTSNRQEIKKWIARRKRLYRVFIESTLLLLVGVAYFWIYSPLPECVSDRTCVRNWVTGHVADIMYYVLPKFLDGFTTYFAIMHPYYLLAIVAYFVMLRFLRNLWRHETHVACERARQSLLKEIPRDDARASDGSAS